MVETPDLYTVTRGDLVAMHIGKYPARLSFALAEDET
jgi:hypothetical protein